MKPGDLVKRSKEWIEDDTLSLTDIEKREVGIITAVFRYRPDGQAVYIVHWPSCGLSHDDAVDLEIIKELELLKTDNYCPRQN